MYKIEIYKIVQVRDIYIGLAARTITNTRAHAQSLYESLGSKVLQKMIAVSNSFTAYMRLSEIELSVAPTSPPSEVLVTGYMTAVWLRN